jgi:hypothetical protein
VSLQIGAMDDLDLHAARACEVAISIHTWKKDDKSWEVDDANH